MPRCARRASGRMRLRCELGYQLLAVRDRDGALGHGARLLGDRARLRHPGRASAACPTTSWSSTRARDVGEHPRARHARRAARTSTPQRLEYRARGRRARSRGAGGLRGRSHAGSRAAAARRAHRLAARRRSLEVKFERRGAKSVTVRPDLEGEPADGLSWSTRSRWIPRACGSGGAAEVLRLRRSLTETIDVSGLDEPVEREVRVSRRPGTSGWRSAARQGDACRSSRRRLRPRPHGGRAAGAERERRGGAMARRAVRNRRRARPRERRPDDRRDGARARAGRRARVQAPRRRAPPHHHRQGHAPLGLHVRGRAGRRHLLDGRRRAPGRARCRRPAWRSSPPTCAATPA